MDVQRLATAVRGAASLLRRCDADNRLCCSYAPGKSDVSASMAGHRTKMYLWRAGRARALGGVREGAARARRGPQHRTGAPVARILVQGPADGDGPTGAANALLVAGSSPTLDACVQRHPHDRQDDAAWSPFSQGMQAVDPSLFASQCMAAPVSIPAPFFCMMIVVTTYLNGLFRPCNSFRMVSVMLFVQSPTFLALYAQSPKVPTMAFLAMVSMSSWGNWSSSIARRPRAGQPFHAGDKWAALPRKTKGSLDVLRIRYRRHAGRALWQQCTATGGGGASLGVGRPLWFLVC